MEKELTVEEIKLEFIKTIRHMVKDISLNYLEYELKERLELLAFEILALIDGEAGDLPPFLLSTRPDVDWDIAGNLHHEFYHLK